MITVQLEGGEKLQRLLMGLGPKAGKAAVRKALRPYAEAQLMEWRRTAPRLTGALIADLYMLSTVRAGGRRGVYRVIAKVVSPADSTPASLVETGHKAGSAIVPANPYVRRPFDRDRDRMERGIGVALWNGIMEAVHDVNRGPSAGGLGKAGRALDRLAESE